MQRYAIEVVKALDLLLDDNPTLKSSFSFILLVPQKIKFNFNLKNISIKKVGALSGHLWEQIELPFYCKNGTLLCLCNTGPILIKKQYVTIHDAAVFANPRTFSHTFRGWYKTLLPLLSKRIKGIITVSNFSKNEIAKFLRIKKGKITVIYEGKEHIQKINGDKDYEEEITAYKPYILCVSSLNPNKNFQGIIEAFKINAPQVNILIAGKNNSKVFKTIPHFSEEKILFLGYVDDSKLKTLYQNALCFVYPSFYEGFGLPPIEAMACGCPVIASNTSSIPEICKNAALYCDPYNAQDISHKIIEMVNNTNLQNRCRNNGYEVISTYTWSECANKIIRLIL